MLLREVRDILDAEVLCGEDLLDTEVLSACGSDFMSDVLAHVKNQAVLLTGLVNPQVIRTADMMDMKCIVFVRGKRPDEPCWLCPKSAASSSWPPTRPCTPSSTTAC